MGWLVLPVTILLVLFWRSMLLPWTAFLSAFQAASVLNLVIGGHYPIGVQPGMFAAAMSCLALSVYPLQGRGHQFRVPCLRPILICLGIFLGYALASSYLLPHYFANRIYVYPPREGLDIHYTALLHLSSTNLSQDFYAVLMACFFWVVCQSIVQASDDRLWRRIVGGWMLGGAFAASVGLYQIVAPRFGLPFPAFFFNSNLGYAQAYRENVGSLQRLSGTFTEPSVAAFFLTCVAGYAWWRVIHGRGGVLTWIAAGLTMLALLLTTSTTAYIALFCVGLIVAGSLLLRVRLSAQMVYVALAFLLVIIPAGAFLFLRSGTAVSQVWNLAIVHKVGSMSYLDRAASNRNAWQVMWQSWGAGVGWGSTRASSLFFNLLANAGVIGFASLAGFLGLVVNLAGKARPYLPAPWRAEVNAGLVAIVAMLLAGLLAVPDVAQLPLWLVLAMLAGIGARVRLAQSARSQPANVVLAQRGWQASA